MDRYWVDWGSRGSAQRNMTNQNRNCEVNRRTSRFNTSTMNGTHREEQEITDIAIAVASGWDGVYEGHSVVAGWVSRLGAESRDKDCRIKRKIGLDRKHAHGTSHERILGASQGKHCRNERWAWWVTRCLQPMVLQNEQNHRGMKREEEMSSNQWLGDEP